MTRTTADAGAVVCAPSMYGVGNGQLQVEIPDAIECMIPVLSATRHDLLLCSTLFGEFVGPGDFHLLRHPSRIPPSDEVLFNLARQVGAKAVFFGSRSNGPITEVSDSDFELCRRLVAASLRNGIFMADHVLVADGMFRFMSETSGFWSQAPA